MEEEQRGKKRAGYGEALLEDLSSRLSADYGGGYSVQTLRYFRQFYVEFPHLLPIRHAVRGELASTLSPLDIGNAPRDNSWHTGQLNPNLSWTHYRTLLRVSRSEARAFYEIEAIKNNWSARELERQINTMLYERLALSKDKKGLLRLATKG